MRILISGDTLVRTLEKFIIASTSYSLSLSRTLELVRCIEDLAMNFEIYSDTPEKDPPFDLKLKALAKGKMRE